jgi:hypothetical protein
VVLSTKSLEACVHTAHDQMPKFESSDDEIDMIAAYINTRTPGSHFLFRYGLWMLFTSLPLSLFARKSRACRLPVTTGAYSRPPACPDCEVEGVPLSPF